MLAFLSAPFSLELTTLFPPRQWLSPLLDRCPSCVGIIKSSSGTTATGTITTQNAQNQQNQMYSVTLIKKDGQWKIDNLQKQ